MVVWSLHCQCTVVHDTISNHFIAEITVASVFSKSIEIGDECVDLVLRAGSVGKDSLETILGS